jgi:hypothetical protein
MQESLGTLRGSLCGSLCVQLIACLYLLTAAGCGDDADSADASMEDGGVDDGGDGLRDGATADRDAAQDRDAESDDDGGTEPVDALSPRELCDLLVADSERVGCNAAEEDQCAAMIELAATRCDALVRAVEQGRLAFDGAIGELTRLGGSRVAVGTPNPERLVAAVREAGGRVQRKGTRVLIEGMDAAQVGELAHREQVSLHELASDDASLEQVFFSLTEDMEAA